MSINLLQVITPAWWKCTASVQRKSGEACPEKVLQCGELFRTHGILFSGEKPACHIIFRQFSILSIILYMY